MNMNSTKSDVVGSEAIRRAADAIKCADALVITAGAGMGVDSGLPDFRGPEGFWGVYPALRHSDMNFSDIADPAAFEQQPALAWGFYGHRLKLYRETPPGESFAILARMAEDMPYGAFVFTSNVDGHFQKAGFPANRICEVHGSIHHLQCLHGCMDHIWSAGDFLPEIDTEHCLLTSEMPSCPHCGAIARPNILMFGDYGWLPYRQRLQMASLNDWMARIKNPVVIEIGAGTAIPTVRSFGENHNCTLIRINKNEYQTTCSSHISLPLGGLEGLSMIENAMEQL